MRRVYLPATLPVLATALETGRLESTVAYAVTPALREWYAEGGEEELEYVALTAAARASLRLLDLAADAPRRRVVVAADVADELLVPGPGDERAEVRLAGPVPWSALRSAHVDDPAAEAAVAAAADAVIEADLGGADAQFALDEAEGHELQWYAVQEIGPLVELA